MLSISSHIPYRTASTSIGLDSSQCREGKEPLIPISGSSTPHGTTSSRISRDGNPKLMRCFQYVYLLTLINMADNPDVL